MSKVSNTKRMSKNGNRYVLCSSMTENGISVCSIKESLAALLIQRQQLYSVYTLCNLAMDKTTKCFYTWPLADTGRCFCKVRKFGFFFFFQNEALDIYAVLPYQ